MDKVIKLILLVRGPIIWCCLFALSGCIYHDEPAPKIVYDPMRDSEVTLPPIVKPSKVPSAAYKNIPQSWLPPSRAERQWTAIVIHHSATKQGNAAIFDKWHKEGNYWEGVGYDFVIGNGTSSGDGEVEVTFRWREQRTGAHCKTPDNWANEKAVGICLVGNFEQTAPTVRQLQSFVKLVRFLQERYGIPKDRIYGHNTTPGARETDCPGRRFPTAFLKSVLD